MRVPSRRDGRRRGGVRARTRRLRHDVDGGTMATKKPPGEAGKPTALRTTSPKRPSIDGPTMLRGGSPGVRKWNGLTAAARKGATLSGADLGGIDLTEANLRGVSAKEAGFAGSTLARAKLADGTFDRA